MSNLVRAHSFGSFVSLGVTVGALAALAGCASSPHTDVPPNARVDILQTDRMVLRGTAEGSKDSPSCKSAALPAKHLVELKDDLAGHMILRPAPGQPALKLAVFHVTHLDTNRTWCVQVGEDGATATIPGTFPTGVYGISVTEAQTPAPHRYEVVVEKL
jgi:hypothetical protein